MAYAAVEVPQGKEKGWLCFLKITELSRAKVCREVETLYFPSMMGPGVVSAPPAVLAAQLCVDIASGTQGSDRAQEVPSIPQVADRAGREEARS